MKFKLRVLAVVLLLALTFLSVTTAEGAGGSITIKGKGQPWAAEHPDGRVDYGCDPVTQNNSPGMDPFMEQDLSNSLRGR